MFPTVGVEAENDIRIGQAVLRAKADVIKVDLEEDNPNTVIVNFNTRKLTLRTAAHDPAIKSIAYAFYTGRGETVTHILIDIDETSGKLDMVSSTFRSEVMEDIRKMLYHVGCAIVSGTTYSNTYMCKECGICPDFTL